MSRLIAYGYDSMWKINGQVVFLHAGSSIPKDGQYLRRATEKDKLRLHGAPCPVCGANKRKYWHLVCERCWAKLPEKLQEELHSLYLFDEGSLGHREACRKALEFLR